ncbi:phage integrase SAM-like domain and Arm DNA-binding domain-containing protein [Flavihumibacter sp. RY-1]|uniref:Phage integrase SAM-like domain and Arm DNA-binding domain-containing protein n=2 Tax=Flavihumibacter fluminis TaxID=2909236 RepID=A0ABS9BDP4_9BACT|nr:phage integrase SAM-like domain and Arm DNA-binding domain-containing protein [Flavihumibacter fluminis]
MRIQVGDSRSEINTGVKIPEKFWNSQAQKVLSKHPDSEIYNETLEILRDKFNETYRDLLKSRVSYTAETFKKRMQGEQEASQRTLMEAIVSHNKYLKSLVGKDYAPATVIRYQTLTNLLTVFLSDNYQRTDFLLSELSVKFLQDFEHYLKTVRNCNHNTTAKYLKNLKKVINTAIVNQWIDKNPFLGYKITIKQTMKDYLVEEEIKRIEAKIFPMERLEAIRKIFLFQCYSFNVEKQAYFISVQPDGIFKPL